MHRPLRPGWLERRRRSASAQGFRQRGAARKGSRAPGYRRAGPLRASWRGAGDPTKTSERSRRQDCRVANYLGADRTSQAFHDVRRPIDIARIRTAGNEQSIANTRLKSNGKAGVLASRFHATHGGIRGNTINRLLLMSRIDHYAAGVPRLSLRDPVRRAILARTSSGTWPKELAK